MAHLSRVSISQLYDLTGRDRRWIKKRLAEAGVEPVGESGRAILFASRRALAAIFDTEPLNLSEEQAPLNKARADLAELELAERRGDLVPSADVEVALVSIVNPIALALDSLPTKAAPQVRAAQSDVQAEAELRRIVDQMRTELADRAERYRA